VRFTNTHKTASYQLAKEIVMMKIVNITQHTAVSDQLAAGVVELNADLRLVVSGLLTFDSLPTKAEILERAEKLAQLVESEGFTTAMIGGAPWFMAELERQLAKAGVKAVYAFSQRVSVEDIVDGTVIKRAIFKHVGFVGV